MDIKLPKDQAGIPNALSKARDNIGSLEGEIKVWQGVIQAIQSYCKHPKKYRRHHYDGSTDTYCNVCDKEVY